MPNKISKVQLNNELYSLKGDANNIKDVMQPTVDDLYSKITTGADSATILLILENISGLLNSKADKTELNDIWSLINALNARIPNSTINYYFAYKASTQVPQRPGNDLEYVPSGWTGYPIEPNSDEVLYMTMARTLNGNWLNWDGGYRWTLPIAYSDNQLTLNIEGNVALYKLSVGAPTLTDEERRTATYPSGWSTTPDFVVQDNKEVYMITAKTLNGDFVLIQGYYWSTPMRIGNGTTSGTGADGNSYNYVYFPSSSPNAPSTPTFTVALIEQSLHIGGWYDRPLGVNENRMYEYISLSIGNDDNRKGWTSPVLWSKWGERGMDGDAVEYIYKRAETEVAPTIPYYDAGSALYLLDDFIPTGWTDNPLGVDANTSFEYVATRKKKDEVWQRFEGPWLWSKYGKDGAAGVVNGYLMTCNNSSVIIDDDLFTKSDALSRFNAIASATFILQKTDGSSINPSYEVGSDSNLPTGIVAQFNRDKLSFTGSFNSTIQDGDVFYVNVNGKINGTVVATLKLTIYVKNFSSGESYRLIVAPTSKKVGVNGKFESDFTINVKFLVIGDTLSTNVNFSDYNLSYDIEVEGNSANKAAEHVQDQNAVLQVNGQTAPDYYIINLYKDTTLVDSQTVSIYKDGEKGEKGDDGSGTSVLRFEAIPSTLVFANNSFTSNLKIIALWNNVKNLKVVYGDNKVQNVVNNTTTFEIMTLNNMHLGDEGYLQFILKDGNTQLSTLVVPILYAKLGINGAVLRYRGIWKEILNFDGTAQISSPVSFEYKSHTGSGEIDYIDVVSEKDNNGSLNYYLCIKPHTINNGNTSPLLSNTTYWTKADQFKFIVTETLIADYIAARSIAADDVVIRDGIGNNTNIVAGMTSSRVKPESVGGLDVGDVRIWAGTSGSEPEIQRAPFIVDKYGALYSSNATISGHVNATSGSFVGDITANSLSVVNNGQVLMLFRPAPAGIEGIPEGAPALYMFYNGEAYIVNMTKLNTGGETTVYGAFKCYVVDSTLYSLMRDKLLLCHTRNGLLYFYEPKHHYEAPINLTTELNYYLVYSDNLSINNKVFKSLNSSQPFSGICIEPNVYSEFVADYNGSSDTGTHTAFYKVWTYDAGVKNPTPGLIKIGLWHKTNNLVDSSDFEDISIHDGTTN